VITEDVLKALETYRKKTGYSAKVLFQKLPDIPEGLTHAMVQSWIGRNVTTARKDFLEYILKNWGQLCNS
jgi:hypothetical protein